MDQSTELEQALEVYLGWRERDPRESEEELLAAHSELGEYLRPLLFPEDEVGTEAAVEGASEERTLGDFRLRRELGRGGMGVVYEAWQIALGRPVALKVLAPHLTHSATTLARFKREATAMARLQHPSIVAVHGFGTDGDTNFIAMDLVRGIPLDQVIKKLSDTKPADLDGQRVLGAIEDEVIGAGSRTASSDKQQSRYAISWHGGYVETVVRIAAQVADALEYAHENGIVHRDVKPSNILLRDDGRAVLTDFGLARQEDLPALTATGDFAGSPHYVSPEQAASSSDIDQRTDVFSLGTTLYELLTLKRPFDAPSSHEILANIQNREPVDPQKLNPSLPPDLVAIVLRALEKRVDQRYQNVDEFASDLRAFLDYRPVRARRPSTAARFGRWMRREPVKASLLAAALVVVGLGGYVAASLQATSVGYELLQEQEVERLLSEAYIAISTTGIVEFEKCLRVLEIDPGNPYALMLATRKIKDGEDGLKEAMAFLDEREVPGRNDVALERIRAAVTLTKMPPQPEDSELVAIVRQPPTDAVDCFVAGHMSVPHSSRHDVQQNLIKDGCGHLLNAILRAEKASILPYLELAMASAPARDPELARRMADALMLRWPDELAALYAGAIALMQIDIEEAAKRLEKVVAMDPSLVVGWRNLGYAYQDQKRLDDAIRCYSAALDLDETDVPSLTALSAVSVYQGDPEAAVDYAQRALDLSPGSAPAVLTLAMAVERVGRVDEALALVKRAVEIDPRLSRAHRGMLGLARVLNDVPMMRAEHIRWTKVHPGGPTAHREFGEFLLEHGDGKEDLQLARRAIEYSLRLGRSPDPWSFLALSRAHLALGDRDAAHMALNQARAHPVEAPDEKAHFEHDVAELQAKLAQ